MNRQLAKHHAAARLRRENERSARQYQICQAIHEARHRGREEGRASSVDIGVLPRDLIEEVKSRMCDHLAAELARSAREQLPPDAAFALQRVAEEFAKTFRWSLPTEERAILRAMMEHHGHGIEFRLSLPPMNAAVRFDRRDIALRRRA